MEAVVQVLVHGRFRHRVCDLWRDECGASTSTYAVWASHWLYVSAVIIEMKPLKSQTAEAHPVFQLSHPVKLTLLRDHLEWP